MLVANGHSWASIKKYTLSEIGTFYKIIMLVEKDKKIETLSNIWMGTHLEAEDIKKEFKRLGMKQQKIKASDNSKEVQNDWNKLVGALRGL